MNLMVADTLDFVQSMKYVSCNSFTVEPLHVCLNNDSQYILIVVFDCLKSFGSFMGKSMKLVFGRYMFNPDPTRCSCVIPSLLLQS